MIRRAAVAVVVALAALLAGVAWRAERLLGPPATRIDIDVRVPHALTRSMDDLERAWRTRLAGYRLALGPAPEGTDADVQVVRATVHGAPVGDAPALAAALDRAGTVRFHWVVSDSATARAWFRALGPADATPRRADGVRAYADSWSAGDGDSRVDYFVAGPSPEAIRAALAEVAPDVAVPADQTLAFEHVVPRADAADQAPFDRTYLIETAPILTEGDVATAQTTWDQTTGRPEVVLDFTAAGAATFGDQTADNVGRKLAIVVDGAITSAPVVNGAIRGGRATITVGADSPERQAQAAEALTRTLRGVAGASLPPGLHATVVAVHDAAGPTWLVRVPLALAAGLAAFLIGPLVARARLQAAPLVHAAERPSSPRWPALVGATAITLGLPLLAWYLGREVLAPGVNGRVLDDVIARGGSGAARAQFGVFALGLGPYLAAVMLAELVAMLVPGWRSARLGAPADRRALDLAIAVTTVGLAVFQGWMMLRNLAWIETGRTLLDPRLASRVAFVLTLGAGPLVLLVAARAIDRWGVMPGVVAVWCVPAVARVAADPPGSLASPAGHALVLTAAMAEAAALVARRRPAGGGRLPWGGVVPAVALPIALGALGLASITVPEVGRVVGFVARHAGALAVGLAVPVFALALWDRRGALAVSPVVVSLVFVAALVAAPWLLAAPGRAAWDPITAVMLGAAAVELVVGGWLRLRLPAPTPVLVVHDVDRADRAADRLAAAGIAHAVVGAHLRALLRFVGAFTPVTVVVAAADAAAAAAVVADDGPVG